MCQEVTIRIRFNRECLGAVRKTDLVEMVRDPGGRIMMMPTWWTAITVYAAKVLNRHQDLVRQIDWDPIISGTPKLFRRYYGGTRFVLHEAFLKGDEISVHCVMPTGMTVSDLQGLMEVAGTYKGISPYRSDQKYGTFTVSSVAPRVRDRSQSSVSDSQPESAAGAESEKENPPGGRQGGSRDEHRSGDSAWM